MTMRSIDSRFWSDGWVRKLNALDRDLFLYLLTNDHSTWCGVYELDLAMMAFESGVDKEDLERAMLPRLSPKVIYVDGWVYVPNWMKYHLSSSGTMSIQHKKGFETAWKAVPERIRLKIREIEGNGYPMVGVSPSSSAFTSSLTRVAVAPQPIEVKEGHEESEKPEPVIPLPYSVQGTFESWKKSTERRLVILAWFFQEKGIWEKATTKPKLQAFMYQHNKSAIRIAKAGWSNAELKDALEKVLKNEKMEQEWTLSTLEKYLTK